MNTNRESARFVITAFLWPLMFLILLGAIFVWHYWPQTYTGLDAHATLREISPRGNLADDEKSTIAIFSKASPAVVHITTLRNYRRDSVTFNVQQVPQGTGSGFVWDKEGHVVTNYHVLQNADAALVILADRSSWEGRLVGDYADKDLAVLAIKAPKERLFPLAVGTSHDLQVGQKAFAIGNPFGLDRTLTTGVVSAVDREIQSVTNRAIKNVIQTDAAINPGNSGGPLLDSSGRLIGVNTSIVSPSGGFTGVGFAIPVDEVNQTVVQIIRHGKVVRPVIGVELASDQLTRELDLKGGLVVNVLPGSPAAKAGLQPTRRDANGHLELGDLIGAIDGHTITSVNDLFTTMDNYKVGDTVTVTVRRQGKNEKVQLNLAAPE